MSYSEPQDNASDTHTYEDDIQFEDLETSGPPRNFRRWRRLLQRLFIRKFVRYWLIGGIVVSLGCLFLVLLPSLPLLQSSSPPNMEADTFAYSDSKPASSFSFIQVITAQYIYVEHLGTKEPSEIRALRRSNGSIVWRYQTHVPLMSQPVVAGNILYIHIYDGHVSSLYALNASTGVTLWKYVLPTLFTSFSTPVTIANGIVYDTSLQGEVIALHSQTGKYIWSYQLSNQPNVNDMQVTQVNDVVYLLLQREQQFIALDALSGALLWQSNTYFTFFAASSDISYVSDQANNLYVLASRTGKTLWKSSFPLLQGQYTLGPSDLLMFVQPDGSVEALHVKTASMVWRSKSLGPQVTILRMINNHLYAVNSNASQQWKITSLEPSTGTVLWTFNGSVFIQVKGTGDYVYVKDVNEQIYTLQAETGKLLWSSPLGKSLNDELDSADGTTSDPTFQIVDNHAFITTLGENNDALTVLDNSDGHMLWQRISIIGVPSLVANVAYITGVDGVLYAYAGDSGKLIWSV
jgi:outer membrane protein assembly factor BamB